MDKTNRPTECYLCQVRELSKGGGAIVSGLQVMDAYIAGENLLVNGVETHFGKIGQMKLHDVVVAVMLRRISRVPEGEDR
jgi:hypothetical protein